MNRLGELQGFIASHHFDILLTAGDINVDFDRPDPFRSLLVDFTSELDMSVCDLPFKISVRYTYECSQSFPSLFFKLFIVYITACQYLGNRG